MKKLFFIFNLMLGFAYSQTTINYYRFLRSNIGTQTMWDGVTLDIYGITNLLSADPKIPAPTIYCNEGDSVVINTLNISQFHHHTIHLHGLDVDTRNDGDPMTSFSLEHLQDTTYSFKANHAGTYMYHCHVSDVVHVQMGMYGSLIVRAAGGVNTAWTGGPGFDKEYNFLTSEIDRSWHDTVPETDTHGVHTILPLYIPDYFLVNGKSEWQLDADSSLRVEGAENDHIYLRLSNIGFNDNLYVFPASLQAQIIDSDGRPLPSSYSSDSLFVSPGERYGVMLNPTTQLTDSIYLAYVCLNTGIIHNVQYVDVNISGYHSIEPDKEIQVEVFPNPTTGVVNINFEKTDFIHCTLHLTNVDGEKIWEQILTSQNEILHLDHLPNGTYFLRLNDGHHSMVKKIVLKK